MTHHVGLGEEPLQPRYLEKCISPASDGAFVVSLFKI